MKRSTTIARTLPGEDHVNRLRVPEYGVREFRFAVGGQYSKCHRPKQSPEPQPEDKGSDDFHFVPEKEILDIEYEIFDPGDLVEKATLELYRRFDEAPLWKLELHKLGDDCLDHGKHVLKWDGRIVEPKKQAGKVNAGVLEHDLNKLTPKKTAAVFPDGYVTLEHTPYKLKLTLSSGGSKIAGHPAIGWTYFHLLVHSIVLELGAEEMIPAKKVDDTKHKLDKEVRQKVSAAGGVPAAADTRKVPLLSNMYRTKLPEMDDSTLYKKYEKLWGDGPVLPIVAKIRLADSAGAEVKLDESDKGAVALGNVKFLWDYKDEDEDVDGTQAANPPKGFIKNAVDYDKAKTKPGGDNCHADRGGKRGGSKPVFPSQKGYKPKDKLDTGKFPFKVEWKGKATAKREWASTSQAWTTGTLKGQTGVAFQPSRMAGDDYKLTVYLAYDKTDTEKLVLDTDAEPLEAPAAIQVTTGLFQVWREVHLTRYIHKNAAFAPLLPGSFAGVQAHFRSAYIDLVNKLGTDAYELKDHRLPGGKAIDYDKICKSKLKSTGNKLFNKNLATDASFDHASVSSMIRVRRYDEFVQKVHESIPHKKKFKPILKKVGTTSAQDFAALATHFGGGVRGAAENLCTRSNADIDGLADKRAAARFRETKAWLEAEKLNDYFVYCQTLGNIFFGMSDGLAKSLKLIAGQNVDAGTKAREGVTAIEFDFTHTYIKWVCQDSGRRAQFWYGKAVDTPDTDQDHCLIMFWEREGSSGADKFAHELGHNMFLPHAKSSTGDKPDGTREDRHDAGDGHCLMSYDSTRPSFCGLCQLRMRGWSEAKLDKTSASNKKP
jgi:hypothetical protein